jgi:ankyrin repeat protein
MKTTLRNFLQNCKTKLYNYKGLVKFALDHGAPIDSVVNGYMPLQLACISENHIAVVQYLIDRGADINAQR